MCLRCFVHRIWCCPVGAVGRTTANWTREALHTLGEGGGVISVVLDLNTCGTSAGGVGQGVKNHLRRGCSINTTLARTYGKTPRVPFLGRFVHHSRRGRIPRTTRSTKNIQNEVCSGTPPPQPLKNLLRKLPVFWGTLELSIKKE